ncbi:MAG: FAD-dependent oxidoreductase, partial [Gammaproteobacteria bacterium]|nr:FAD-dependent oxidoreductase [Gammaproteobacteria bacterium]
AQIKGGVLDMIGAARPSIADPFLPNKIAEGRIEDIRECIGCNVCVSGDFTVTPIRCTQNPTMGEEYRRGWHPERIAAAASDAGCLVVGGGPAGLEAALALAQRGYRVTLADDAPALGGRINLESALPGLASYARVRDYRLGQLRRMANVSLYPASKLSAKDIVEFGARHVALATGSHWRRDGLGRQHWKPIPGIARANVYTPDDLMRSRVPEGRVVLYDDDHYYLGGVLAELLANRGCDVTLVTPAPDVSHWTHNTLEQARIEKRVRSLEIEVVNQHALQRLEADSVTLGCIYTDTPRELAATAVVLVTSRAPETALYEALNQDAAALARAGIDTLTRIGDCLAPGTVAAAVYAGHRYARELEDTSLDPDGSPFRREYAELPPLA